jgi:hypothetical protein
MSRTALRSSRSGLAVAVGMARPYCCRAMENRLESKVLNKLTLFLGAMEPGSYLMKE